MLQSLYICNELQNNKIFHKDLRPENFIYVDDILKISDFCSESN